MMETNKMQKAQANFSVDWANKKVGTRPTMAKRQTSGKLKIPFALPFGILNSHHLFMQNWSSLPSREGC
jgi:hypothetical protein